MVNVMIDKRTKATIDKREMLKLRLEGRTYQYIANKSGITRQRIQQILSPPPSIRKYIVEKYASLCADCGIYVGSSGHVHHNGINGEDDFEDKENLRLLCISCHRRKHAKPPQFQCRYCGKAIGKGIFCDSKCLSLYHTATLICSYCGKSFEVNTSKAYSRTERSQSGLIFCSKKCQGKWLGNGNRKWDYEKIYQTQDTTGFGAVKLGCLLGIPQPTIYGILKKRK